MQSLGDADDRAFAVLHPVSGVALIDIAPRSTPAAEDDLARRLEAAGFTDRFGALPPIAYLAMEPGDTQVGEAVAAAFTALPPLELAPGPEWVAALRGVLAQAPVVVPTPPVAPASPVIERAPADVVIAASAISGGPRTGGHTLKVFWSLLGVVVVGGGMLLHLAGPPRSDATGRPNDAGVAQVAAAPLPAPARRLPARGICRSFRGNHKSGAVSPISA